MEKLLEYIYTGKVEIQKCETKDFKQAARILKLNTIRIDANFNKMLEEMVDSKPMEIIWTNRGETFAESFKELYHKQENCDAILEIGNMDLKAHRIVLSACSEFFKCFFNEGSFSCEYEFSLEFI